MAWTAAFQFFAILLALLPARDAYAFRATIGFWKAKAATWSATSTTSAAVPRFDHSGIWTGSKMIVWGGCSSGNCTATTNTGGQYDPVANSWSATSTSSAPATRMRHVAVWTDSKMIIWGGYSITLASYVNTGGVYDPVANTWTSTATSGAPTAAQYSVGVWTGSQMIVCGGYSGGPYQSCAKRYDPGANAWSAISTTNAPTGRVFTRAIWTGSKMIVWGGCSVNSCATSLNTGAIYDPVADTWIATSTTNAPAGVGGHSLVWTGSKMLVWGGLASGTYVNTGGIYDPDTDSWTALQSTGAPVPRQHHGTVWTGSRMIVWGGYNGATTNSGGIYNPTDDSWTSTATSGVPSSRYLHTAVWTGSKMIVWGGYSTTNTGGMYVP